MVKSFLILFTVFSIFPWQVQAYIDPGTTGTIFSALASIGPVILVILGFLFWPIKKLIKFLIKGIKRLFNKISNKKTPFLSPGNTKTNPFINKIDREDVKVNNNRD